MRIWILPLALVAYGAWQWAFTRPLDPGPGIVAPTGPVQSLIHDAPAFAYHGYAIRPLADFSVEARVLHVKSYNHGRESDLSPVDFAVGWGPMSNQAVLDQIQIGQSNRFFYWQSDDMPLPRAQIEHNSANLHIIPANQDIARSLRAVRPGHVVQLRGYLVRADNPDGWHWISSLTRTDVGAGACELVWVEELSMR